MPLAAERRAGAPTDAARDAIPQAAGARQGEGWGPRAEPALTF